VVHAFQLLFIDCNYPKAFVWWIGCHGVLFFCLFSDFYKRSYKNAKSRVSDLAFLTKLFFFPRFNQPAELSLSFAKGKRDFDNEFETVFFLIGRTKRTRS
jgi:hypothetical protein